MDTKKLFEVIRKEVVIQNNKEPDYIYAHMDDTLLRKRGKKIFGAGWLRDPLGPPFVIISFGVNGLFKSHCR